MKRTHIIAIVIIATSIAFIFGTLSNSSTYANFDEAFSNLGKEYHVVGKLDKMIPVVYDPAIDANLTIFTVIDNNGSSKQVKLKKTKPQDFERSENVVLIGKAEGNEFVANDVLMKCPSKYTEQNKFNNKAQAAIN
jgi:cytochrome c-type biogenesis protein CcmE